MTGVNGDDGHDRNTPDDRSDRDDRDDRDETPPPSVALVLGSGGARGYAHIGVIQVLREAGVDIVAIAGSSMGALVGGLHAAGSLDDYTDWVLDLGQLEVIRLMDVALSGPGAIRGDKVFGRVSELLGGAHIEELPIPFTAVAVDLLARREVWFQEGPVDVAVRASTSIPSFFVPTVLNGRVLVDGGVLNPVPVAPVAAARADLIVAVNLAGRTGAGGPPVSETADEVPEGQWSTRLRETANRWFDNDLLTAVRRRFGSDTLGAPQPDGAAAEHDDTMVRDDAKARDDAARDDVRDRGHADDLRAVDVVQSSYEIMQDALTRHRLAGYAPDLLLTVPKTAARTLDFHRAGELIELGREIALTALPELGIGPAQASP